MQQILFPARYQAGAWGRELWGVLTVLNGVMPL